VTARKSKDGIKQQPTKTAGVSAELRRGLLQVHVASLEQYVAKNMQLLLSSLNEHITDVSSLFGSLMKTFDRSFDTIDFQLFSLLREQPQRDLRNILTEYFALAKANPTSSSVPSFDRVKKHFAKMVQTASTLDVSTDTAMGYLPLKEHAMNPYQLLYTALRDAIEWNLIDDVTLMSSDFDSFSSHSNEDDFASDCYEEDVPCYPGKSARLAHSSNEKDAAHWPRKTAWYKFQLQFIATNVPYMLHK